MVPEYDEFGNKTGNMIPVQTDEESEATRAIREAYNVPQDAEGEFLDVGSRGLVGRPTYNEDDIDLMEDRAASGAFRYTEPISNQQGPQPVPMEIPQVLALTPEQMLAEQAKRARLSRREGAPSGIPYRQKMGGKNPKMDDLMKRVRAKYGIR